MAQSETRPKGNRPIYIARVKQTPESEFMITIGAAFAFSRNRSVVNSAVLQVERLGAAARRVWSSQ